MIQTCTYPYSSKHSPLWVQTRNRWANFYRMSISRSLRGGLRKIPKNLQVLSSIEQSCFRKTSSSHMRAPNLLLASSPSIFFAPLITAITTVRTVVWGEGRGGLKPPQLEIFPSSPALRASYQGKRNLLKIPNAKNIYSIQWKFSRQFCFHGMRKLLKNLDWKKIYSIQWKFSGQTLYFRASASCSKILNDKKYFNRVKNLMTTPIFMWTSRCSKILIDKNIYSIQWIQGTLCFSGQTQVDEKSWMEKVYSIQR